MAHGTHREHPANGEAWEKTQRTSPTKLSPGSISQSLLFTSWLSSLSAFTLPARSAPPPTIFLPAVMLGGLPLARRCLFRTFRPSTLLDWLAPVPVLDWLSVPSNGLPA